MVVYIMVDMEGISGIISPEQVNPDGPYYNEGRRYATWEVNTCIEGCLEAGADKIIVRDTHYRGKNLIWEELSPHAEYIIGASGYEMLPYLEESDALILLGHHAMAGTEKAILEHTMSSTGWQNFWLNGQPAGEIAIEAAIAGDYGIPTIMVSGDDKACAEAKGIIPDIVTAEVKKSLSCTGGRLLSKDAAHDLIRKKAAEAIQRIPHIKPFKVEAPVTMRLELVERQRMPFVEAFPYMKRIDGRTYEVTGNSVIEALRRL